MKQIPTFLSKHCRCWFSAGLCLLLPVFLFSESVVDVSEAGPNDPEPEIDVDPIDYSVFAEPVFEDVSVHDPSVVQAGEHFYVFGSHLAAARTTDWMVWESVADGATVRNPLFANVFRELADTFLWAQTRTLWAADVFQGPEGQFRFYYNACKGDSSRSALGLAVAEAVEGPYQDAGILLRSGMWGRISEDGLKIYDASVHPNVVDPDVFMDAQGKNWMVYGSYSGGLFILEMDNATGLPLPGQGYGKHLMGGNHQRIEGPCIIYSPHTKYYYLFVSYGGLAANGGYQIRVARSETPDGPYLDPAGQDMREVRAATAFNDVAIAPYGAKIMGNHRWQGWPGSGYVSPGHNTAWYDESEGRYLLIFHTRFPGKGEFHQVRVHEFFFNEAGWPVVSPLRFVPREVPVEEIPEVDFPEDSNGEDAELAEGNPDSGIPIPVDPVAPEPDPVDPDGDVEDADGLLDGEPADQQEEVIDPPPHPEYRDSIPRSMIPGVYQLIELGREIRPDIPVSATVELHEDGTVDGAWVGGWSYSYPGMIVLTDALGVESKGVLSIQWNEWSESFTLVFSVMSVDGLTLWGIRDGGAIAEDPADLDPE